MVRRLAAGVDRSRVELHVATMRPNWDDVDELPMTFHPGRFDGSRYRLRDRIAIVGRMARLARRLRPDVVQLHSGMGWLGLGARVLLPRTPFVVEVHDAPGSGRHGRVSDGYEALLVRMTRAVALCHSTEVESALREVSRLPARSIRRFPLGVDTEQFCPVAAQRRAVWRTEYGIAENSVVAVAVARPARLKRFDLIVEAVAAARSSGAPLELVLVGPAGDGTLRCDAERFGISPVVHLPGALFDDDLALALGSCDILCSASEYEGFGLTMAEGMSCGLPVVATGVGGVPDVVDDGVSGMLVEVGDVAEFARHLSTLATEPGLRASMGAEGRRQAEGRMSIGALARSFEDLYSSLTAN